MVQNAMLASPPAAAFGFSLEECAAGLASTPLTKARLQLREIHGVQFLDDSYNANPDSMKAALRTLRRTRDRRAAHRGARTHGRAGCASRSAAITEVGEAAAALRVDHLITVGELRRAISRAAEAAGLETAPTSRLAAEAAELLCDLTQPPAISCS